MVKGTSRQVIVVQTPDPKLFEQAIFILSDQALGEGVSEEALLKEAQEVIRGGGKQKKHRFWLHGAFWAAAGSLVTGLVWAATVIW